MPKLSGQDDVEYRAYVKRAMYYEAVPRTIDGFVGAIARKPAEVECPEKLMPFMADASLDGTSLHEFIKRCAKETLLQARSGLLVDYDESTKRCYFSLYVTESIINWWDAGIVLKETVYEPDPQDQYKKIAIEQYRELTLVNGAYTVNVWRKNPKPETGKDEWIVAETLSPTKSGKPLAEIPFFWLNPLGKTNSLERPPLLGMVNISLSHYRSSADLEHGCHFAGLPTLYVAGASSQTQIRVGANSAIILDDPQAKVGYAEFTGQGLGSLERALDRKESQMAALGAAVFQAAQRRGVEAAETARLRISGENSLLIGVVDAIEETLVAALNLASDWMSAGSLINVKLNRDFISSYIEPQALQGLVAAYQAGAITLESFLYSLQKADMIPPERDLAEEAVEVRKQVAQRAADEVALANATKPKPTN